MSQVEDHLKVVAPGRERELRAAIEHRYRQLVAEDADLVVDGPSEGMLKMSAVVLAAFEELRGVVGDDDRTVLLLRHLFGEVLRQSMEVATKRLAGRKDPLDGAAKVLEQSAAMYGTSMDFEFERSDDVFEMRVVGCFFQQYFARHDADAVTTVLCAWDANRMRALDPATMGVTAERTSLMSLGDDACRFRVRRTDDSLAGYSDALDNPVADA